MHAVALGTILGIKAEAPLKRGDLHRRDARVAAILGIKAEAPLKPPGILGGVPYELDPSSASRPRPR